MSQNQSAARTQHSRKERLIALVAAAVVAWSEITAVAWAAGDPSPAQAELEHYGAVMMAAAMARTAVRRPR